MAVQDIVTCCQVFIDSRGIFLKCKVNLLQYDTIYTNLAKLLCKWLIPHERNMLVQDAAILVFIFKDLLA